MAEIKKSEEPKDYNKPRFAFRLTVDNHIICQRDFNIGSFNPLSLSSIELAGVIESCGRMIDESLKNKTQVYLEIVSPRIFDSVEEMNAYFENPYNCANMTLGEGIVVRGLKTKNYYWGKNNHPEPCSFVFDRGELSNGLTDDDRMFYKFAFLCDDREVCAYGWEGVYPKFVRNSIDLTNKRGQFEGEDVSKLSFDQYILYNMVKGKRGIDWVLIRDICATCSQDNNYYTTHFNFGKTRYNNVLEKLGPKKTK